VPVGFYVQQVVDEELHRCFSTNLSATGVFLEIPPGWLRRGSRIVQVELPLPGTSDSLWAKGDVVYDCFDGLFHGSAVHFTGMALGHRRLLQDWLHESNWAPKLASGARATL
jgi:hypothetical protein